MRSHQVTGGGGTKLHVRETGNSSGRGILFIHGFSQNSLSWSKQLSSDLANDFRLLAVDNRGHGFSEKPRGAYGDSKLWAEDVHSIITTLNLDKPVLSGWSYGGVIISDYIRFYGEGAISGTHWVGAVSKLGEPLLPFLTQECLSCVPGVWSTDALESIEVLSRFLRYCTAAEPTVEDFYFFLGYNVVVPPYVREALFARTVDNDDLLPNIRKPALITHGTVDGLVRLSMADHNAKLMPHARKSYQAGIGHAPFWEDPRRFNGELRDFVKSLG